MRCLLLLLSLLAGPAWAWNGAGHRLVAALAWEEMSEPARQRASQLLEQHPDYPLWRKRQQGDDLAYGVFLEAATWPDDIRRDRRFHDQREAPTPLLPGFPDMERHGNWHYLDLELEEERRSGAGEIDSRLRRLARDLERGPEPARVYALPWLLHLVADIHQPLHVAGRQDRGGNGFQVENPFNPRKPFMSLHAYWDELPGPPWLRGKHLERHLPRLRSLLPVVQGEVALWREESHKLVLQQVYPTAAGSLLPLVTPEFFHESRQVADQRVAAAGQRLGRWLDRLLKD